MILISSSVGSKELLPMIRKFKVEAELSKLEAGDFCFYGNTDQGQSLIGIERKRIDTSSDLLDSISSGRYAGLQQHNMTAMYGIRIMIVEGIWKCSEEGYLLVRNWQGWHPVERKGQPMPYDALYCWLLSMTFTAGTYWMQSTSPFETAKRVVSTYRWFNKPWEDHHSQAALFTPAIAQFSPPTFEQMVAAQLPGVGVKKSLAAAQHFKSMSAMVRADEQEWMQAIGVAGKTARKIVNQIRGVAL